MHKSQVHAAVRFCAHLQHNLTGNRFLFTLQHFNSVYFFATCWDLMPRQIWQKLLQSVETELLKLFMEPDWKSANSICVCLERWWFLSTAVFLDSWMVMFRQECCKKLYLNLDFLKVLLAWQSLHCFQDVRTVKKPTPAGGRKRSEVSRWAAVSEIKMATTECLLMWWARRQFCPSLVRQLWHARLRRFASGLRGQLQQKSISNTSPPRLSLRLPLATATRRMIQ